MFEWYRKYTTAKALKQKIKRLDTSVGPRSQAHEILYCRMMKGMMEARYPGCVFVDGNLKVTHVSNNPHNNSYNIIYKDYPPFTYYLGDHFENALMGICMQIVEYREGLTEPWELKDEG